MKAFNEIQFIVIHCSATKPSQNLTAEDIRQMHTKPKSEGGKGWRDIGYHFVIQRDGTLESGRPMNKVGAHAYGFNKVPDAWRPMSWGVCMIGGVDESGKPEDNFTSEQFQALNNLLPGLMVQAPKAAILGHRDLSPDIDGDGVVEPFEWLKSCPCFDVKRYCSAKGLTRSALKLSI